MRSFLVAYALLLTIPSAAQSAELVMFWRAGCHWCEAWDREIGPIYPKTDIGRRLQLRRVNVDQDDSGIALSSPIRYTPSFVLVENQREIGRINGYPGDAFFWGLLERLEGQLRSPQPPAR
jgi:hypothetical protein